MLLNRLTAAHVAVLVLLIPAAVQSQENSYLQISGVYPHLATHNQPQDVADRSRHGECGTGGIVPWADRLWYITYPQHKTTGSNDKLYEVDSDMNLTVRPESVGGTHACRMIHRESKQLIIGPYFIDENRNVRAADLEKLRGRMTAVMRHLVDPANKVYFFDMEGAIYEVDVHSLEVNKLFAKPVPGWHGKGGYTAQNRVVIANNGEHGNAKAYEHVLVGGPAASEDEAGILAEWDGKEWRIVERKQFTDVTGPGGIWGNPDETSQLWSIGWGKRSVILKLLDGGKWSTFRLPKGSHTFDPRHGWFTEWPRIREIAPNRPIMCMHATMFDFPIDFSAGKTGGIRPISTHLRYIPDFCHWNGRVILGADDASMMRNPMCGQGQSNLWFGTPEDLAGFGPRAGWGGVWVGDELTAGAVSDPFLVAGYDQRTLHIAIRADTPVQFTLEVDRDGTGNWQTWKKLAVTPPYHYEILPSQLAAEWMRITADGPCIATAYFHMASCRKAIPGEESIFDGLADVGSAGGYSAGLIRPAAHNRSLQFLAREVDKSGHVSQPRYLEVSLRNDGKALEFETPAESRREEVEQVAGIDKPFEIDDASVIMVDTGGRRYRLPKGNQAFDKPLPAGWPRGIREAVSERYLANIHGTFYEIPRGGDHRPDIERIKPVSSHSRAICDFCTWRGLLVLSGVRREAERDGQVFGGEDGTVLWFGVIDDLWKLGKPVGRGGPWKDSAVESDEPSDPYLMTGYDKKLVELSHDHGAEVTFSIEINFDHRYWRPYQTLCVPPGKTVTHCFPDGFHSHWVRVKVDQACKATAWFTYD